METYTLDHLVLRDEFKQATHVKMILEVNPDCVGDMVPGDESAGRIGGVAVDLEASAAAEEAAVSSLSSSLCRDDATSGDERRPDTVDG